MGNFLQYKHMLLSSQLYLCKLPFKINIRQLRLPVFLLQERNGVV